MTNDNASTMSNAELYAASGFHIDGVWTCPAGGPRLDVVNPATEERIGEIPLAQPEHLDAAVDAAARGFARWRKTHAWDRAAVLKAAAAALRSRSTAIARIFSIEQGKPLIEAEREVGMAADHFDWAAQEAIRLTGQILPARPAGTVSVVEHRPVGVVAAFTPWNFPALQIAAKVAYALAAGCTVVLKPSEEAPGIAILLVRALHEAGLPAGALNLVFGNPAEVSERWLASPKVQAMSFTGSTRVGKLLAPMAAASLKRMTLELGGHAPVIVYPDFPPGEAAALAGAVKFRNAGQACVSPSRFFVHEAIAADFTRHMVDFAGGLVLGEGTDPVTTMGPLVNAGRVEAAAALVADAVGRGAVLHCGGGRPPGRNTGFFFEPTVLSKVSPDSRIMHEEPFAPIAPIIAFGDGDDVVGMANDVDYGLGAYVLCRDEALAARTAEGLDVGMVGINNLALAGADTPFGGVKGSGLGREGGPGALDEFLQKKMTKRLVAAD
ncbi:NAD-dependent succinate-semialdehyde dehydrogenase [Paralimibaculum aggregatum]|uniref:NAD-dependent succinate-semialdehyde dehydrogenase n=1 Tax=Paralimibaculum aggregatum TaxID=3036245 RepID=A0ABQ6LSQ0_9RHOB|nr:NAD-dependent succinate-semialdehyde dehydrogenase [Limibaculum sp. NKW23]GMG85109.1 NAD-dependent succinate-semialdehyde dehydrogenase [Limibaculum sp. NKW23]